MPGLSQIVARISWWWRRHWAQPPAHLQGPLPGTTSPAAGSSRSLFFLLCIDTRCCLAFPDRVFPIRPQQSLNRLNKLLPFDLSNEPMKAIPVAISCILALPFLAQSPVPRQPRPRPVLAPEESVEGELKENITIRLQGTTTTGSDIDLSLSGIGPRFTADQVVNDDTVLTCQFGVSETGTGYRVSYSVSARIKVITQTSQNSTNFEYRDVSISGNVLCIANRPVVVVSNGSKQLLLTISKQTEGDADHPAAPPKPESEGHETAKPESEPDSH